MIKLLAFDLDGTILVNHKEIPEKNLLALQKAHEKGIYIVPSTGRLKTFLPKTLTDLGFIKYAVTANGGAVYDIQNDICIHQALIDTEKAKEISKIIEEHNLYFEFYLNGDAYTLNLDIETAIKKYNLPESKRYFLSKKYSYLDNINQFLEEKKPSFQKINFTYVTADIYDEIFERLNKMGDLCITSSIFDNIEINNKFATKGLGLEALCEHLNIKPDEVMTIGDSGNDISMLEWAGTSVAMENGTDDAKSTAKFQTGSCENCGFADAVYKYAL